MARQIIDTGTLALNGKDGDTNRDAADKCNANFAELYNQNENFVRGAGVVPGGAMVVFAGTTGNQVAADPRGAPGTAAFKNSTEFATAAQGAKADNAQVRLVAGEGINIDNSDPAAPVISAEGGSGGGTVQTVAGVDPVGADIPAAALATALGVDNKLDADDAAASAVKLQTARTINGVSFDGTANITVEDDTKEPAITPSTNARYWNGLKQFVDFATSVRASILTGISFATATAVVASDSVLVAIGKLQAQVSSKLDSSGTAADSSKLGGQLPSYYTAEMTGASAGAAGLKGLVPAPAAGATRFLSSLGTWITVTATASWGGITGALADQADLKAALDAKQSISSAPFTKSFTSGQTVWTAGGLINFNPGFDPALIQLECVVTTAQGSAVVGDRFDPIPMVVGGGYVGAQVSSKSATTITVRCGGSMLKINSASSGDQVTPANCRIVLRAWA